MGPGAESQRQTNGAPGVALDRAIRGAFAHLELHRHDAFLLTYSKHRSERHEGRFLMAAIDRLERYLHVAEELTDLDAMRSWVEDVVAEELTGRGETRRHRLTGSGARKKGLAQARERFEEIAAKVQAGLEAALSKTAPPVPKPERRRCTARTRQGTRCKNPADDTGLCSLHSGLTDDVAALLEAAR